MSTAPAPRPFEAFDDDFDADLDFDHLPAAPARAPMPFTAGSDAMPADGYNPVGEVVAQAEASLAEPPAVFLQRIGFFPIRILPTNWLPLTQEGSRRPSSAPSSRTQPRLYRQ